ncbi:hypothetical protein DOY81_006998 [Sarcophaga bullata]|nr:hypothetical protein DOY81_006998 [Sarcophaga bullata]
MACLRKLHCLEFSTHVGNCIKPLADKDRVFTNLYGRHDWHLKSAMSRGDWHKTKEIIKKGPEWIVSQLEESGIKGRGGANYPVGEKLKYMLNSKAEPPRYVVINAAEGEPGTCKDRDIMRHEPHKIIEGSLLVGRAMTANVSIIFIRHRFYNEACNLQMAIAEAYRAGLIGKNACDSGFDFDIYIHRNGGHYISGEETALMNCIMGSEARPRLKPPFPSEKGIWDSPTILFNAETVSYLPSILRRGPKWFMGLGCNPHSPGTKIFNISGRVERPCTVEENLGISLRYLIERHAGGVKGGWDNLLAVIPGGASTPLLTKNLCDDIKLDEQSLKEANSSLGTGAIIVIDKSCDILKVMQQITLFYMKGSCHQCTRCRGLSTWAHLYAEQFRQGIGQVQEIDWLWEIAEWAKGNTICSFADGNAFAVQGFVKGFRHAIVKSLRSNSNS